MSAEQDYIISIRTTADTAGIRQMEAQLKQLGVQVESVQKAGEATAGGGGAGRGIGALFGVSAVGVGLAVKNLVEGIGNEQVRITQELDKQLTHLTELSQKWAATAASARSQADVEKLALSTLTELEAAQKRMNDYQNAGLGFTKQWADTILSVIQLLGGPKLGGLFAKAFEEQAAQLANNVVLTRQAAIAAADLALEYKEAFDEEKAKPFAEAVASITAKIQEAEAAQAAAGTANIEKYTEEGRKVEQYKAQLQEIIQLENQRKHEADETAAEREKDVDFVQKQIQRASPQARAVLMNEQAAQLARDQGRQRDADLFQQSAERFKQFATPAQKEEISVLEKLIEQNRLLREIRDTWR
jgi:hypothetical protein